MTLNASFEHLSSSSGHLSLSLFTSSAPKASPSSSLAAVPSDTDVSDRNSANVGRGGWQPGTGVH